MSRTEKMEFIKSRGVCLGCLKYGYMKKDCRGRNICKKWKGFHPTSLHLNSAASQEQNSNEGIPEVTSHRIEASNSEKHTECYSHSLIMPVWLNHEQAPQNKQLFYALLDDQSDACFIKDTVLEKLQANGPEVQLKLSTVLAEEVITCTRIDGLIVQGVNEATSVRLPKAYSREDIPAKREQILRPETGRNWPHLLRIADQLMPYSEDVEVGLLLGTNCARAIKPTEVIPGREDDPYAKKTALGWGVIVVISLNKNEEDHNHVYHLQKLDKIRVVFDASAECKEKSLNRHLLQGPDLTNSFIGVLCRFCKKPIAFTCDVEGIFHQVYVNPHHRNLLRFLWWGDGDIDSKPTEFRMTVHLFGATSSPGCANFAMKRTADDFKELFGSELAKFVKEDFYVDDGLKSVPSGTQASAVIESTKSLLAKGGLNVHKFISKSKEVIKAISKEQQASGIKELDLSRDVLPIERALRVQWCLQSDALQYRVVLKDKPLTRRGILSSISSIYDPLGLAAPFLLKGKQILQDLCKT
ncbi:uncharacterized protein [Montipora capricornis]|uniref:uncharacterized protein n=1 Tax=Montipora capricornis TaxID=246305 RepID=UPI0035F1EE43